MLLMLLPAVWLLVLLLVLLLALQELLLLLLELLFPLLLQLHQLLFVLLPPVGRCWRGIRSRSHLDGRTVHVLGPLLRHNVGWPSAITQPDCCNVCGYRLSVALTGLRADAVSPSIVALARACAHVILADVDEPCRSG